MVRNEEKFSARLERGSSLPNIRSVADGTFFLEQEKYNKLFAAVSGSWTKLNITPDDILEFDQLHIKHLFADNFTIRQTDVVNGDLMISDSGIVDRSIGRSIRVKDSSGKYTSPFKAGDLICANQVSMDKSLSIKYVTAQVSSVKSSDLELTYSGNDRFATGDVVYRVGSATDSTRQDSLYFSTNLSDTPYFDVNDGINSFSAWTTHLPKVRIGKLTGITDPDYGVLTGYGVYAQNIFLKGKILITNQSDIDGSKITNTEAWTAGADWSTNLSNIPTTLLAPSGSGLYLSSTNMGFYNGSVWKTYMDNAGNFYLGGTSGALTWAAGSNTLTITNGTITSGIVQTSASGQRIVLNGSGNIIDFYSTANLGNTYLSSHIEPYAFQVSMTPETWKKGIKIYLEDSSSTYIEMSEVGGLGNILFSGTANFSNDINASSVTISGYDGIFYNSLKINTDDVATQSWVIGTFAGSSHIATVGTIISGTWQGTPIADSYISSAATWNAKAEKSTTITLNLIRGVRAYNYTGNMWRIEYIYRSITINADGSITFGADSAWTPDASGTAWVGT